MQSNAEIRHNRKIRWDRIITFMVIVLFMYIFIGEWTCNKFKHKEIKIETIIPD